MFNYFKNLKSVIALSFVCVLLCVLTFLALFKKIEGPGKIDDKVKKHPKWDNFYTPNKDKIKIFWEATTIAELFEKYFNLLSDLRVNITNREIQQLALRLNEFLGISEFMEILQEELDFRKNNPKKRKIEILKDVSESIKKTEETASLYDLLLKWRGPWLEDTE